MSMGATYSPVEQIPVPSQWGRYSPVELILVRVSHEEEAAQLHMHVTINSTETTYRQI